MAISSSLRTGMKISSGFVRLGWKRSWVYLRSLCRHDYFTVVRKKARTTMGMSISLMLRSDIYIDLMFHPRFHAPSQALVLEDQRNQLSLSLLHSHSSLSIRTRSNPKSDCFVDSIAGNSTGIASLWGRLHLHPLFRC